jgi:hypothetical protein
MDIIDSSNRVGYLLPIEASQYSLLVDETVEEPVR